MKIYKIIALRLKSQRFPNKILCHFNGKSLVENSLEVASKIDSSATILTASEQDFVRIRKKVDLSSYKYKFIPSSNECNSSSDRIVEIHSELDGDLFVSIPADEPSLIPQEVRKAICKIQDKDFLVYTLYCDFYCRKDAISNLSAKVVINKRNEILYMSRSVIPVAKNGNIDVHNLKKNVGVFFFRRKFLDTLEQKKNTETFLDKFESLEQLRWLELGIRVNAMKINHFGFGIDIPTQISELEERLKCLQRLRK